MFMLCQFSADPFGRKYSRNGLMSPGWAPAGGERQTIFFRRTANHYTKYGHQTITLGVTKLRQLWWNYLGFRASDVKTATCADPNRTKNGLISARTPDNPRPGQRRNRARHQGLTEKANLSLIIKRNRW
jgi:hypothetical protein